MNALCRLLYECRLLLSTITSALSSIVICKGSNDWRVDLKERLCPQKKLAKHTSEKDMKPCPLLL